MLSADQLSNEPRWKQARKRYEDNGELRLKSGEDKLARRIAGMCGMRGADKKLYKWELQNGIESDPGASLWSRVLVYASREKGINTSKWVPIIARDNADARQQCGALSEDDLAVIYFTKTDTDAAAYMLQDNTFADDLPLPCKLWKDTRERVWVIFHLKGIMI